MILKCSLLNAHKSQSCNPQEDCKPAVKIMIKTVLGEKAKGLLTKLLYRMTLLYVAGITTIRSRAAMTASTWQGATVPLSSQPCTGWGTRQALGTVGANTKGKCCPACHWLVIPSLVRGFYLQIMVPVSPGLGMGLWVGARVVVAVTVRRKGSWTKGGSTRCFIHRKELIVNGTHVGLGWGWRKP